MNQRQPPRRAASLDEGDRLVVVFQFHIAPNASRPIPERAVARAVPREDLDSPAKTGHALQVCVEATSGFVPRAVAGEKDRDHGRWPELAKRLNVPPERYVHAG